MIEGIEVLNKVPIMELGKITEKIYGTALALFIVFLLFTLISLACNCKAYTVAIFAIATLISFIVASISLNFFKEETGRYEYQCMISDEISFVDMYEKYEVVSKDGEVWTIRDKEEVEE